MTVSPKELIKRRLADISYGLYRAGVLKMKHDIKVMSIDETIDALVNSEKSLVRFGDGEMAMMRGVDLKLQKNDAELAKRLEETARIDDEALMVTVPDIFDGLSMYIPATRRFWKDHLLVCRRVYERVLRPDRVYGSTSFSRCYATIEDKTRCAEWFYKIREIWRGRDVLIVEGEKSRTGVGNDLLDGAGSVKRLIGPPKDAYSKYDAILKECLKQPVEAMYLLALGPAAKPLAGDLFKSGRRVIDIGNLGLEYSWFLAGVTDKGKISDEEREKMRRREEAGLEVYSGQIVGRIDR